MEQLDTENSGSWTRLMRSPRRSEAVPEAPPAPVQAPPATVIEPGCSLEGKLSTDRAVRVEGDLRGSIVTDDTVLICEGGSVEGEIRARRVVIRGAVVGNVIAPRDVLLEAGGKLHGDVDTASLVIERGAFFNGQTRMRLPQHASRAPAASATPPASPAPGSARTPSPEPIG